MGPHQTAAISYGGLEFPPDVLERMGGGTPPSDEQIRCRVDQLQREFNLLEPHLPTGKNVFMLDIGAGLGAMSVLIARHVDALRLELMDGFGEATKRRMGYHLDTDAWFDAAVGADFCRHNLDLRCHIGVWPPDPGAMIPSDLIVSFKSWGHHYPISNYIPLAQRSLMDDGVMIVDLRRGKGGREELDAAGFRTEGPIMATPKLDRFIIRRRR